MFQLIISHTINIYFGLAVLDSDVSDWTFWTPFVWSITNSKIYKISAFNQTCFLRSYGQLGIVLGARVS